MRILLRVMAAAALLVVVWALATAWGPVVHGHPAYPVLLAVTLLVAGALLWWSFRLTSPLRGWRLVGVIVGLVLVAAWLAVIAWLKPFGAVEPALTAMASDASVTVEESATAIVLRPADAPTGRGLLYQPGARVDARAYAAMLRPLAEAGVTVVIPKQPLGIAFLATGALDSARAAHPEVASWVVGGHSLGGTVAASTAESDASGTAPVTGLLLHASYPASDMSGTLDVGVLSVSGSEDGLATPTDIESSVADLPPGADFVTIDGGVHAFFGDYGPQPGDGQPGISHDQARAEISAASLAFVIGAPVAGLADR
jgi:hypothetical protein